jgi:hypothetical protein
MSDNNTAAILGGVFGGISAVTGIVSAIDGAGRANEANRRAKQNAELQRIQQEGAAQVTNAYNKLVHFADQENYKRQRQYEYETAIRNWNYQTEIQDFQYLQAAKQFAGSVEATQEQLVYNSVAQRQAVESEQAAFNEIMAQDAFQREGMLIEQLQNEGKAAMMQAGGSRTKAIQSTIAEVGRNSAILRASLMSSGVQSERNLRDIAMSRYADDIKARNAMMIEPERLPDIPKPTMAPERIFVEPMAALPGYTPAPAMQSAAAPIFQGISSAAATVGGMAMQAAYYGRNSGGGSTTPSPQPFDYTPSYQRTLTDTNSRA